MAEQDERGSISAKSKPLVYLPPRQRAYDRAMSSVERPSGIAGEGRTLEGVRGGARESRAWAGGSIEREPCPATLRDNQGHPCYAGE